MRALRLAKHNRVPHFAGIGTGRHNFVASTTHGLAIVDGDTARFAILVGLIAPVEAAFPIVTL